MTSKQYYDPPDRERLSRILWLAHTDRPVDALIERLEATDGATWLSAGLSAAFSTPEKSVEHVLTSGRASLAEVRAMKERSKKLVEKNGEEPPPISVAGYFLSAAAALAHHRTLITTRSREELEEVLRDLQGSLDGPWRALVEQALAVGDSDSDAENPRR